MSNFLFYKAVLRKQLPISNDAANNGWPPLLYPYFLACMQFPDGDQAEQRALTYDMGDAIESGTLPCVRQAITWFDKRPVEPHIAPAHALAWLQRRGLEPSPLMREWLEHNEIDPDAAAVPKAEGQQRKLTDDQEKEIARLYDRARGLSVSELARQFHVSRLTIDKILKRANVKISAATPKKGLHPSRPTPAKPA